VISRLTEDRLLTRSDGTVEVAHEALLREWPRLREWLEEDSQGRQLRLHITQTARQWGAAENDASELYRGARLSAALDWSAEHAAELNNKERDFLAASRQASDRETDRQRRVNRRLRGLLVGVATLLIVALVAGSLALVQRSRAQRAATVSLANTLGADGINQPRLDRGLLLAREAMNLQVSDQTKSNLLWTVLRNPQQVGAIYFGDTGKRPQHIALSPDGKILAVSFNENDMGFYDASTLKQLALVPNSGGPLAPLAFANRSPLFATFGNEHGRRPPDRYQDIRGGPVDPIPRRVFEPQLQLPSHRVVLLAGRSDAVVGSGGVATQRLLDQRPAQERHRELLGCIRPSHQARGGGQRLAIRVRADRRRVRDGAWSIGAACSSTTPAPHG